MPNEGEKVRVKALAEATVTSKIWLMTTAVAYALWICFFVCLSFHPYSWRILLELTNDVCYPSLRRNENQEKSSDFILRVTKLEVCFVA